MGWIGRAGGQNLAIHCTPRECDHGHEKSNIEKNRSIYKRIVRTRDITAKKDNSKSTLEQIGHYKTE